MLWHRQLRHDMQLSTDAPTQLVADNQGALALVKDPVLHARTDHVGVHYRQCVYALRAW